MSLIANAPYWRKLTGHFRNTDTIGRCPVRERIWHKKGERPWQTYMSNPYIPLIIWIINEKEGIFNKLPELISFHSHFFLWSFGWLYVLSVMSTSFETIIMFQTTLTDLLKLSNRQRAFENTNFSLSEDVSSFRIFEKFYFWVKSTFVFSHTLRSKYLRFQRRDFCNVITLEMILKWNKQNQCLFQAVCSTPTYQRMNMHLLWKHEGNGWKLWIIQL